MKTTSLSFFLLGIFTLLISFSQLFASSPTVILEQNKEVYALGPHLEYLADPTGALSVEEVSSPAFAARFISGRQKVIDFVRTSSVYWVRFQLRAQKRDREQWLLKTRSAGWKLIQLYFPSNALSWIKTEGGKSLPFDPLIFINNTTVFRLPQPLQQDQTIYIRLEAAMEISLDIKLWSAREHQGHLERGLYLFGMFHGLLLVMAVYNLFLFLSLRDKSYLYYALYVSALLMFFMIDDGVWIQFFWRKPGWLITKIDASAFCVFEVFFILFVKSFLKTRQNTPVMDKVLSFSMAFSIGATVSFFGLGIESQLGQSLMVGSILFLITAVITAGILCMKKGYAPAMYFLLATSSFIGALAIAALQAIYILPGYDPDMLFIKAGAILEVVLYSFALADRLKYERKLKEESQQRAIEEQKRMTLTFEKFVPRQFLRRIANQGLENIEPGRAQSAGISILFSDIRSFTHLSETMSPQELMNFLNEYFSKMNEPIRENNGYIDKFIGDAIMALFDLPEKTDQDEAICAVRAAIGMQESLKEFNRHRIAHGGVPIITGIGIHGGPVVIGTVGSEDRMDSTVLGDVVNLASRLEGLTKQYRAQIIISSRTWNYVKEDTSLCWRELDFVNVKGRDQPERIYEIFNTDEPDIRDKKQEILKPYREGLANYYSQNWDDSIAFFEQCLEIYPQDIVSQKYLERCLKFKQEPPPENWDGASRLDEK